VVEGSALYTFSVLILLVGWQEGHPNRKKLCQWRSGSGRVGRPRRHLAMGGTSTINKQFRPVERFDHDVYGFDKHRYINGVLGFCIESSI